MANIKKNLLPSNFSTTLAVFSYKWLIPIFQILLVLVRKKYMCIFAFEKA